MFLSLFSEFDGYSGVGKKLSWPITFLTVPGSLTNQLDLPFCFKIASKKLQRLQIYVHSVIFPYITDFIYDEWPETHHQHSLQSLTIPAQSSITNNTPKGLVAENLLQELKTAAGLNTNKIETNWRTVMRMVKKFLCAYP